MRPSNSVWRTRGGQCIPIAKLGDRHLLNILASIERKAARKAASAKLSTLPRGEFALMALESEAVERTVWEDLDELLCLEADARPCAAEPHPQWRELVAEATRRKLLEGKLAKWDSR